MEENGVKEDFLYIYFYIFFIFCCCPLLFLAEATRKRVKKVDEEDVWKQRKKRAKILRTMALSNENQWDQMTKRDKLQKNKEDM